MSIRDYSVERDHFNYDNKHAMDFPCCVCTHNVVSDRDEPCRRCDHNIGAVPQFLIEEPTISDDDLRKAGVK